MLEKVKTSTKPDLYITQSLQRETAKIENFYMDKKTELEKHLAYLEGIVSVVSLSMLLSLSPCLYMSLPPLSLSLSLSLSLFGGW